MALHDQAEPNVATCKMRLYEHHFDNVEGGKYIARPANKRTLSLEDLVEDMKSIDGKKHGLAIKHINSKETREYARRIKPEITDIARVSGQIFYLLDTEEPDAPHNMYLPGNAVRIIGEKIKIAGDSPECGVYFVPVDDPAERVKMARIFDNTPGRIIGMMPEISHKLCRIEVVTQHSTGNLLKEPRVITSDFTIEAL